MRQRINYFVNLNGDPALISVCSSSLAQLQPEVSETLLPLAEVLMLHLASGKAGGYLHRSCMDEIPSMVSLANLSYQLHHDFVAEHACADAIGFRSVGYTEMTYDLTQTHHAKLAFRPSWVSPDHVTAMEEFPETERDSAQVLPKALVELMFEVTQKLCCSEQSNIMSESAKSGATLHQRCSKCSRS